MGKSEKVDYGCSCGYYIEGSTWNGSIPCPRCAKETWSKVDSDVTLEKRVAHHQSELDKAKIDIDDQKIRTDIEERQIKKKRTDVEIRDRKLQRHRVQARKRELDALRKFLDAEENWIGAQDVLIAKHEQKIQIDSTAAVENFDIDSTQDPKQLSRMSASQLDDKLLQMEGAVNSLRDRVNEQLLDLNTELKHRQYQLISGMMEMLMEELGKLLGDNSTNTDAELERLKQKLEEFQLQCNADSNFEQEQKKLMQFEEQIKVKRDSAEHDMLEDWVPQEKLIELNNLKEALEKLVTEKNETELVLQKQILSKYKEINSVRKLLHKKLTAKYERMVVDYKEAGGTGCCSS